MQIHPFTFRIALWNKDFDAIMSVRKKVFVKEQNVPEEIELDDEDPFCTHFLVETIDGSPIATARISKFGKIGRMAVLKEWRNRKVGTELMKFVLNTAIKEGLRSFYLHSQVSVISFYKKFGFKESGEVFYEADIPHQKMTLEF